MQNLTMVAMKPNKRTTQKEIARLAKIGPDFLSHIIHGRRPCPPSVAVRLEEVTGISRVTWVWGTFKEIRTAIEGYIYQDRADYGHRYQAGGNRKDSE
jgi:DNA-binding transcriptional regulator YdaS (Cro superfamily)